MFVKNVNVMSGCRVKMFVNACTSIVSFLQVLVIHFKCYNITSHSVYMSNS